MTLFPKMIAAAAVLLAPLASASAMPDGDHMMKHEMSKKDMKKLAQCKAMDHAMAMKNKRCMKLMKAEEMHGTMGAEPMHDSKM